MKKLLTLILTLALLLPAAAVSDLPDISGLTYDELVQLKNQINLAMWNSEEWQEVTVPIGVWKVGEDIPAGKWHISVSPDAYKTWGIITYCDRLDKSGLKAGNRFDCDIFYEQYLDSEKSTAIDNPLFIEIDCLPGTYIIIDKAAMVFTPATGKPDLGFK